MFTVLCTTYCLYRCVWYNKCVDSMKMFLAHNQATFYECMKLITQKIDKQESLSCEI